MTDLPVRDETPLVRPGDLMGLALVLGIAVAALRFEGHRFWCRCGRLSPWSGNIWSSHNSQHFVDPYSFTHVLHGLIFYAVMRPLSGKIGRGGRLVLAAAIEAIWEVLENSPAVIARYRESTISVDYSGDTLLNSIGDIVSCVFGFFLASRLPVRWSLALLVLVEATMLMTYRDCLVLNVMMLVSPIEAVKVWQTAGAP